MTQVQSRKFKHEPNYKQFLALEKLYDDSTHYIGFGGSAGGGKSWLMCEWEAAMCLNFPGVRYFLAREELKSLKETTVKTFFKMAKVHGITDTFRYYEHYGNIKFHNGSEISLIELKEIPSDPDFERLGSTEYTGGGIEEASEVHFKAFDVLKSRVGRHLNDKYNIEKKVLLTFNPKKNWLYTTFYQPWKTGKMELGYEFIQALASENNKIDKGYLQSLDEIKDKNLKARLKYGEWEYEDDPLWLIDNYESLLNIFTNEFVAPGKKYITADIARFGKDKIIIRIWDGLRCINRIEREKLSIVQTAELIKQLARQYFVPMTQVICDEDGVGGGVVDILRCTGFVANSTPRYGANFDNLKSQCGYRLSELINQNLVYDSTASPAIQQQIKEELEQLKRKSDSEDKKMALMPKDKMKDYLGRSPDDLDTFIMRALPELQIKRNGNSFHTSFHKV